MSLVCENCTHWQNGECEVKFGDNHTSANHECDEVMFLFDFALGQGPTLFFESNKSKPTRK